MSTEARERVIKQLEASPNNPFMYNLLGQLLLQVEKVSQAEIAFKKSIELDNSILASYMNLGQLYQQAGKLDRAAESYEAVLQKTLESYQPICYLG